MGHSLKVSFDCQRKVAGKHFGELCNGDDVPIDFPCKIQNEQKNRAFLYVCRIIFQDFMALFYVLVHTRKVVLI